MGQKFIGTKSTAIKYQNLKTLEPSRVIFLTVIKTVYTVHTFLGIYATYSMKSARTTDIQ